MAVTYDFVNSETYAASDVNNIRCLFAKKGVLPDTVNSCKVVAETGGYVKVMEGTALFDSGARITVESDGVTIGYVTGTMNYVYFYNNITGNCCEVLSSTAMPIGDYVMLAEIAQNGTITDKREYSQSRIPAFDSDWNHTQIYSVDIYSSNSNKIISIELFGDFTHFTFIPQNPHDGYIGYYNSLTGKKYGVNTDKYSESYIYGPRACLITPSKSGRTLSLSFSSVTTSGKMYIIAS